jgi:MYXO-CTERM domain-containing protein
VVVMVRISALALSLLFMAMNGQAARAADACQLPNVLVLFDISGSMLTGDEPTKLTQATKGVVAALKRLESDVATGGTKLPVANFGLMVYPKPGPTVSIKTDPNPAYGYCNTQTEMAVPFTATGASTAFENYFETLPPKSSGYYAWYDTPIYQAVVAGVGRPELYDSSRRYVLLITDGYQDCCKHGDFDYSNGSGHQDDCEPNSSRLESIEGERNRQQIVELVSNYYHGRNATIYPIGFSQASDAGLLNRIAQATDTMISPTCDPSSTSPANPDNCYYQANDTDSLDAALSQIVRRISEDICDGVDNDCDGVIDNVQGSDTKLTQTCSALCGGGKQTCNAAAGSGVAAWTTCASPTAPKTETCNGLDDDCDGRIDNVAGSTESLSVDCSNCKGKGSSVCVNKAMTQCSAPTVSSQADCNPPPPPAPITPKEEPVVVEPPAPLPQKGLVRDGCACGASDAGSFLGTFMLAALVLFLRRRS